MYVKYIVAQVCVGPADVAGPGGATDNVPMRILPLRLPGTWLEGDMSVEVRRDAEALFYLLESTLADVAISLTMFETTRAGFRRDMESGPERQERQRSAEQSVRARYDNALCLEADPDMRWSMAMATNDQLRAEVQFARWEAGEVPQSYQLRIVFLYAKAFTFALDTIGKGLRTLAGLEGAPEAARRASTAFDAAFPQLVHVRDSAHHAEDRVRGKDRKGQRIKLQPIVNEAINAPQGGVLVIDQLMNDRYGGTLGDGSYGEVEVSLQSAAVAQEAVQAAVDAWTWKGSPRMTPS